MRINDLLCQSGANVLPSLDSVEAIDQLIIDEPNPHKKYDLYGDALRSATDDILRRYIHSLPLWKRAIVYPAYILCTVNDDTAMKYGVATHILHERWEERQFGKDSLLTKIQQYQQKKQ